MNSDKTYCNHCRQLVTIEKRQPCPQCRRYFYQRPHHVDMEGRTFFVGRHHFGHYWVDEILPTTKTPPDAIHISRDAPIFQRVVDIYSAKTAQVTP